MKSSSFIFSSSFLNFPLSATTYPHQNSDQISNKMMASSARNCPFGLKFAVTLILISFLPFLPSKSVGLEWSSLQQRKMVLGSRPPGCENKCMSCRPCMATLVVVPHHNYNNKNGESTISSDHSIPHREDDPYYLLTWKCKCGNKLYHP